MENLAKLYGLLFIFLIILHSCINRDYSELPIIETADVSSITHSTAQSGGNISSEAGMKITARGVCWNNKNNPTVANYKTTDGTGDGSFLSTLTALNERTTYYVKAYAISNAGTSYGNEKSFSTTSGISSTGGQIIADHNAVVDFDNIPSNWIGSVKKMYIYFPGQSHSEAYRSGLFLLENINPIYNMRSGTALTPSSSYLRVNNNPSGYVYEDVWLTWWDYPEGSKPATATWITNLIQSYYNNGYPMDVIGYGWCWEMTGGYPSWTYDPIYGCRWWGTCKGGIDGDFVAWGLDNEDNAITGNRVNLQDYFAITEYFNDYCESHGIKTKAIYTTSPITANNDEGAWEGQVKHDAIRAWVAADPSRILFDYIDILAYDNNGVKTTSTWNGHTYQRISATNLSPATTGHISDIGAVRLAKAQWWMLARMTGWNGGQ